MCWRSLGMVYGNDAVAREQGLTPSSGCASIRSTAGR